MFRRKDEDLFVNFKYKQDSQCTYNVTLRRIRASIGAVEKQ